MKLRITIGCISLVSSLYAIAEIELDGSLGPAGAQSGDMTVLENMGTRVNENLFHSFSILNVRAGESLTFDSNHTGPTRNVVSRVTGVSSSFVDGLLRNEITGADLWLINPAGVAFGANSSLDMTGALRVSTADYIEFEDGVRFDTINLSAPLSVTNPVAFGYLATDPAPISVDGATWSLDADLELSAGELNVRDSTINTTAGLFLTAIDGPGDVSADQVNANEFGDVSIADSSVATSGGRVFIRGGQFLVSNSTLASEVQDQTAAAIDFAGGSIVIENSTINAQTTGTGSSASLTFEAAESFSTDGTIITSQSQDGASGAVGGITYRAPEVTQVAGFTGITSRGDSASGDLNIQASESVHFEGNFFQNLINRTLSTQDSGDVNISTPSMTMVGSSVQTATATGARAGDITINVDLLDMTSGAQLQSNAASGDAGNISIDAKDVKIRGRSPEGFQPGISTRALFLNPGDAGDIVLNTTTLDVDQGFISSFTEFTGQSGSIRIGASESVLISGIPNQPEGQSRFSGIFANTFGGGSAGVIEIETPSLILRSGASIQSSTFLNFLPFIGGDGGTINIDVDVLRIEPGDNLAGARVGNFIIAGSFGNGMGGDINIDAQDIFLSGTQSTFDGIFAESSADGDAGNININTNNLTINESAYLSATTFFGAGNAGRININATGDVMISAESDPITGIFNSTWSAGNAGGISIVAAGLSVDGHASIGAGTRFDSTGNGGAIDVDVATLTTTNGGIILTSAFGIGSAGTISVNASESVVLSGRDPNGVGSLGSVSDLSGNSGSIVVDTPSLSVVDGASIAVFTTGTGDAGQIDINAGDLLINGSDVTTGDVAELSSRSSGPASGSAGTINVETGSLLMDEGGRIIAATESDRTDNTPATINIAAMDSVSIAGSLGDQGQTGIFAQTSSAADAGNISVDAPTLTIIDGGVIESTSEGAGIAGNILLSGRALEVTEGASLLTNAETSSGGNVDIQFRDLILLRGVSISASANGVTPSSDGGNVTLDPTFVVLDGANILASANAGNGGNIVVSGEYIFIDPSTVLDATSQTGIDGNVQFVSPDEISDNVLPIDTPKEVNPDILTSACTQRAFGERTSLVIDQKPNSRLRVDGYLATPDANTKTAEAVGGC